MCRTCDLPGQFPGAELDAAGVCALCRAYDPSRRGLHSGDASPDAAKLDQLLREVRGKARYDCLVLFSGGKDSIYLLHKLKSEYQLNVLALTIDLDLPAIAWDNIRRTVEKLDVEHVVYRAPPGFNRKLFRFLLQNQDPRGAIHTVTFTTAALNEGYALRFAAEKNIPLALCGYSTAQEDWMKLEMSPGLIERDWTPELLRQSGEFTDAELALFWNPGALARGTRPPRFLAPFQAWDYDAMEMTRVVVANGLVGRKRNASPVLSNSPFQWLLIFSDLMHFGHHRYEGEFAKLVREGRADRLFWRVMLPAIRFMARRRMLLGRNVTRSLEWLGLEASELAIGRGPGLAFTHHGLSNEQEAAASPPKEA